MDQGLFWNEKAKLPFRSLEYYFGWLKSNLPAATEDYALGEQLFREMLWDTERVDISLNEEAKVAEAPVIPPI